MKEIICASIFALALGFVGYVFGLMLIVTGATGGPSWLERWGRFNQVVLVFIGLTGGGLFGVWLTT